MPRFSGLRVRLSLLILAAVVPAFGVIAHSAISQRQQAAVAAERNAVNLVRLAAREQRRLIDSTHQLLVHLSKLPEVRGTRRDTESCVRVLAELRRPLPYYTNFGVANVEGNLLCSALPFSGFVTIADRSYFRRAVEAGGFGVGDYQIGRVTRTHTINFGYAMVQDAQLRGVVYAALDLAWLGQLIADNELPGGSTVTVIDSGGTILARYPESGKWIGQAGGDTPFVKTIIHRPTGGTATLPGLDGIERLYAFAPLHAIPTGQVFVSVGIPTAVVYAAANQELVRNMALLLLAASLALLAAWFGGDIFVLRRINALAAAAQRLTRGDFGARTGLPHDQAELGQLAGAFDRMATALQRVNRAMRAMSATNRAITRATDEDALLHTVCKDLVEMAGYPFVWIAYAEQDHDRTIRPMAQAGFEGGLDRLRELARLHWTDGERDSSAVAIAIRSGVPHVSHRSVANDRTPAWRSELARRGYASGAAFPLWVDQRVVGAVAICANEPDAFEAEELALLSEMAQDIALGIAGLRARTEYDRAHALVERMAYYDQLTGLPNHASFDLQLHTLSVEAEKRGLSLALLMVGLARIREINDALGFQGGDVLLKEVAARLRTAASEGGFVARMRGDEFALLSMVTETAEATQTAQKVSAALAQPFAVGELKLDVTARVGIALFPKDSKEALHLTRRADVAMQHAKKTRVNCAFYAPEHDTEGLRRLELAGELRHAIANGELVLHYQPKVDLRTGTLCGAEALVRWPHPTRGLVAPDEFIPLAEHSGLIAPLSEWVMEHTLRQIAAWRASGLVLPVAVNLSAHNLLDRNLPSKLQQLAQASGIEPNALEIELTEGAVMEDPEGALVILRRLSEMGVALFIDDFGTGYSSLAYLTRLPMDGVKIDKSFVMDMLANPDSAAIVRSTIGLAHELNLQVVAEGIESLAVLDHLRALGCDVAQGYHLGKPVPAYEFVPAAAKFKYAGMS